MKRHAALILLASLWSGESALAITRCVVGTTDFGATGRVSWFDPTSPWGSHLNTATTASDAVVRYFGGRFYVVNRFGGDNIQALDSSLHTLSQFSTGPGSNPHDLAFVSPTKAYVTRYDSTGLWVVNPQTGARLRTIDLAPFADADGFPEMDQAIVVGPRLFVSLQMLDRNNFFGPSGPGRVVVIDTQADTVLDADPLTPGKQAITLAAGNPNTPFEFCAADHRIYVGESGFYGVLDGGIEGIDPVTYQTTGIVAREDSLGGDLNAFRLSSGKKGFAIVSDASFNTVLVSFDLATHQRTGIQFSPPGFVLSDLGVDDLGQLWVLDRTAANPGVRVFSSTTGAQFTTRALGAGLPPQSLAFDRTVSTGVDPQLPPAGLGLRVVGSPVFRDAVRFAIARPVEHWSVLDVRGRVLRAWDGAREALEWDGRDGLGRELPAGVYWVRAFDARAVGSARVIKVR